MNCTENILKKLRESRIAESMKGFLVIDSTTADEEGDSEKYKCSTMEDAKAKVLELVGEGSDKDLIKIVPINPSSEEDLDEADEEESNKEYKEFIEACTSNTTWKKANAICEKYGYKLSPESCVDVYKSGRKVPSVNIRVDRTKDYNPEVYFYAGKFGNNNPTLEIQTTAYGSLTLEKHAEFLEAVTNAHKMVEELIKIDFMTLYEVEADY